MATSFRPLLSAGLCLFGLASVNSARADYFFDQRMHTGVTRTDYNATNEGTSANPLTFGTPLWPCTGDPDLINGCITSPSTFPQSNYWSFGGAAPIRYWVLLNNNEPWQDPGNSGPPDQSLPRAEPGAGIYGFSMIPFTLDGAPAHQAHMVLNNAFTNPVPGAIPFQSIGADSNRGNGTYVGAMNSPTSPSIVKWTTKIWDYALGEPGGGFVFQLWTVANWGGKPRMLFVYLFAEQVGIDVLTTVGDRHWNWQISESSLYNGADIAYLDAYEFSTNCPWIGITPMLGINDERTYEIDITDLYVCASNLGLFETPMPTTSVVPIETVAWSNEAFGNGYALWTSVYDAQMVPPEGGCGNCLMAKDSPVSGRSRSYVPETPAQGLDTRTIDTIRARLADSCRANTDCNARTGQFMGTDYRPPVTRDPATMVNVLKDRLRDRNK